MSTIGDRLHEEIETLRQVRDEVRLQAELGRAEARDAWEGFEKQWHQLEGRARQLREASKEELEEIGAATRLLVDELREGYQRLRRRS
jgi:hypothetical protein